MFERVDARTRTDVREREKRLLRGNASGCWYVCTRWCLQISLIRERQAD